MKYVALITGGSRGIGEMIADGFVANGAKVYISSRKNQDYGDAFATYGPIGVLVRIGDKISRLQNISKSGINLVQDENIRDSLLDLHNYAAMAIMLLDENSETD